MANVYSSEVCLQTKNCPKISKFYFSKTLQNIIIIKKYQYFYNNNSKISETLEKLRMDFGKNLPSDWMERSDWFRALLHSLWPMSEAIFLRTTAAIYLNRSNEAKLSKKEKLLQFRDVYMKIIG